MGTEPPLSQAGTEPLPPPFLSGGDWTPPSLSLSNFFRFGDRGRGVAWQDTETGRGKSPIASSWMDIDAQTLQRGKYFSR